MPQSAMGLVSRQIRLAISSSKSSMSMRKAKSEACIMCCRIVFLLLVMLTRDSVAPTVVNDPEELKAASGCFGLLGVVLSITLQLDDMNIAELAPVKKNMVLSIPPPEGYPIPKEVQEIIKHNKITDADIADARTAFIKRCEEDYYLEWFWFPYQNDCWINTWKSAFGS